MGYYLRSGNGTCQRPTGALSDEAANLPGPQGLAKSSKTKNGWRIDVDAGAARSGDFAAHEPHRVGEGVSGRRKPGPGRAHRLSELSADDDAARAADTGGQVRIGRGPEPEQDGGGGRYDDRVVREQRNEPQVGRFEWVYEAGVGRYDG
uniref:(northern house mosquito) hypothetical protein n=1 Tax=Culex pipiens TaxID=7175 RepID=A0A8D8AHY2_CULPI